MNIHNNLLSWFLNCFTIGRFLRGGPIMRTWVLVPGLMSILIFPGMVLADPTCLAGTVATVMAQGSCTIGDKTFNFNGTDGFGGSTGIFPASITFTPLVSPNNPGFELSGLPPAVSAAGTSQDVFFYDYFSVAAPGGQQITSINVTLNGVVQDGTTSFEESFAEACGTRNCADNIYKADFSPTTVKTDVISPSSNLFNGDFQLDNSSSTGSNALGGTTGFTSADFRFQESATSTTPEPPTLLLFGTGLLALGRRSRKFFLRASVHPE
jgi:PEP-CTERM motif